MRLKQIVTLIAKLLNILISLHNKKELKNALNDPAKSISNGGRVHTSEQTFADISSESKCNKTK